MITIDSESIEIPVLASGRGWLVVDKPAGISVHNAPGPDVCSLALAFIRNEPTVSAQLDMDLDFGVNPVHRLDKETSGVLLLATTQETFRSFSKQFESRQVKSGISHFCMASWKSRMGTIYGKLGAGRLPKLQADAASLKAPGLSSLPKLFTESLSTAPTIH